ncbi:MAG: maleylpyruvate isomerase N-terminal domain-containing protein [Acidimicrobiales bacterium]
MVAAGTPSTESARVRSLVVDAVEAAAVLMGRPSVAAAWDQPSALEGMTVGALSAHLVRAAGATIAYLDRTPGRHQERRRPPDANQLLPRGARITNS